MTEGTSGPQPSRWTRHAPWAVTALAILWGGWGWGKYFVLCIVPFKVVFVVRLRGKKSNFHTVKLLFVIYYKSVFFDCFIAPGDSH